MKVSPAQLWQQSLQLIKGNVSEQQFETWFKPIVFVSYSPATMTILVQVPSPFVYEYLEENFLQLMASTFKRVFGNSVTKLYYNVKVVKSKRGGDVKEKGAMPKRVDNGPARTDARKTPDDVTAPQVQDLDSQLIPDYL